MVMIDKHLKRIKYNQSTLKPKGYIYKYSAEHYTSWDDDVIRISPTK